MLNWLNNKSRMKREFHVRFCERLEGKFLWSTLPQQVAIQASTSLNEIRASIDAINGMNVKIATAAEEQSMTTKEINQNTQNIRSISQSVSERAMNQEGLCKVMVDLTEQQEKALDKFKV